MKSSLDESHRHPSFDQREDQEKIRGRNRNSKQTRIVMNNDKTSFSCTSLSSSSSSQEDSVQAKQVVKKTSDISCTSVGRRGGGVEQHAFAGRVVKTRRRRKRSNNNGDKKVVLESDLFDTFCTLLLLHSLSHPLLRSFLDDIGNDCFARNLIKI